MVDGFRVAKELRRTAPQDFALLCHWRIPFRFRDANIDLRARWPVITCDEYGHIRAVRYNNRSVAPLDLPADVMTDYYRAYRHFAALLRRPDFCHEFRLAPGELLILDNQRVLHGRRPFGGDGLRHLQGCYADMDALLGRLRTLESEGQHPGAKQGSGSES